jgi:hypothetical protein
MSQESETDEEKKKRWKEEWTREHEEKLKFKRELTEQTVVTTQRTAKDLKISMAMAQLLFGISFVLLLCGVMSSFFGWTGFVGMIVGIIWMNIVKTQIWWEHE